MRTSNTQHTVQIITYQILAHEYNHDKVWIPVEQVIVSACTEHAEMFKHGVPEIGAITTYTKGGVGNFVTTRIKILHRMQVQHPVQ